MDARPFATHPFLKLLTLLDTFDISLEVSVTLLHDLQLLAIAVDELQIDQFRAQESSGQDVPPEAASTPFRS